MSENIYEAEQTSLNLDQRSRDVIRREELLDEALMETFPASDAISTNRFD